MGAGLLGCGLFALDSVLLAGFVRTMEWAPALAAHLGLVTVTASPGFGARQEDRPARLQLALWMALLGPFGVLIGLMLFLPRSGVMAEMTRPAPVAQLELLRNGLADGRVRLAGGHSVRPLLDVVIEGSTAEKLEALALVGKRYVPGLAPTLRRALQDADGSVRVLAATVTAKLRDGHTRQIGLLQDAAEATPTVETWRRLGAARLAYAASGLLEPDRATGEAAEGRACLARAAGTGRAEPPDAERPDVASSWMAMADGHAG